MSNGHGQLIAQGFRDVAGSIGARFDRQRQQREQQEKEQKERAQKFSRLVTAFDTLGWMDKEVAMTKSLEELEGFGQGKELLGKLGETEISNKMKSLQTAALERDAEADKSLESAVSQATRGTESVPSPSAPGLFPDLQVPVQQPLTGPRLLEAMGQNPKSFQSRLGSALAERSLMDQDITPVERQVGGRKLIVNPKSGAFQDVTPEQSMIPEGFVALGATMDENGKLDVRYGPPKAEGKALTQTEVQGIAALNQAESDLNTLEAIFKGLGPGYGGPVSGRVKSMVMGGQNPNISALENAITAATPNLARGVFREVGVLTDQDVERYKKLLPSPYDSETVRETKIKQLRKRIEQGRKEVVASLKAAGRDVEAFASQAPQQPSRFDSEAAARAAGAKAGDIIELYDPQTATYRKARLK